MVLYETREEAIANVPNSIYPKNCFVWQIDDKWQVIPGSGCAHWVSHERNYRGQPGDNACFEGYLIRVDDVLNLLTKRESVDEAEVGDIWKQNGVSHIGIVISINRREGRVELLRIRQVSSNPSHPGLGEINVEREAGECYY